MYFFLNETIYSFYTNRFITSYTTCENIEGTFSKSKYFVRCFVFYVDIF